MPMKIDNAYIQSIMHELHRCPELGFDLPKTLAIVKHELSSIGISYTEKHGKSSIVCEINPEKTAFTVAIRADMDALAIHENSGVPYASEIPGQKRLWEKKTWFPCPKGSARKPSYSSFSTT